MIITSADLNGTGPYSSWLTALPITHETVPVGTTTPNAPGSFKGVFIVSQRYLLATRTKSKLPVLTVTMILTLGFQEQ